MTYPTFFAARDTKTGDLFTSSNGHSVFTTRGSLTTSIRWRVKRSKWMENPPTEEQFEAFEAVLIDAKALKSLQEDAQTLRRLEAAGVDNWEGYSYAFDEDDED